ncbi:MAG: hypothetical protein AB7O26_13800 [Planctomycetaceae bacterium]
MNIVSKRDELERLRSRVRELEAELLDESTRNESFSPSGYYTAYYATTGFMLGAFGAAASLLVNVIGAPIAGKHPLELIRVYLTFPLGEKALQLSAQPGKIYALDDGVILAIGCCLYLFTGMLLGILFHLALTRFTPRSSTAVRLVFASVLSIAVWLINFYGILSWLQPMLFGGNWIVDSSLLPAWVAAATHLVFGWTMALVYPLGQFVPYERPTEQQ